ncbi:N-acetylneuraminate synthase family protein [Candidatus Kaiserbacteria bacterium]|nr:N-acetylneuraminate synthase family protein [Candidatus Kaiserbacteria bacterium]
MSKPKLRSEILSRDKTYIISEVGSNFDGDLERAKELAKISKDIGADAYKIQNFKAPKIVSDIGFRDLKISFQEKWDKPVTEVYKAAEFPRDWLQELSDYCNSIDIDFISAPYDLEAVDLLEEIDVPLYKLGSGEIDNLELLTKIAKLGKPMIIACGSSTVDDIGAAIETIRVAGNDQIILLQCVTNYPSPIADANLLAMVELGKKFSVEVGYSDHTIGVEGSGDDPLSGLTVPLGAVALGATVIEKHFTDDRTRKGPDHPFAMDTEAFKKMVDGIRAMEKALGDGKKKIMPSEADTVIIQRRGIYSTIDIKVGDSVTADMVELLRPAVGLKPSQLPNLIGKTVLKDIKKGEPITDNHVQL